MSDLGTFHETDQAHGSLETDDELLRSRHFRQTNVRSAKDAREDQKLAERVGFFKRDFAILNVHSGLALALIPGTRLGVYEITAQIGKVAWGRCIGPPTRS